MVGCAIFARYSIFARTHFNDQVAGGLISTENGQSALAVVGTNRCPAGPSGVKIAASRSLVVVFGQNR